MLFDFLQDMGNYNERKVDRFEKGDLVVSTAYASDRGGYETAISHPQYNDGDWVIVAEYDGKSEAQKEHGKWVEKMTQKNLPESLCDVSTCETAKLAKGGEEEMHVQTPAKKIKKQCNKP